MSTEPDNLPIDETEAQAPPLQYRSLSSLAILGMAVAAFSILTTFGWLFWIIPLAAIFLGRRAIKQIRFAPTEYTGTVFAYAGIATAIVLGLLGHSIHSYIQKHTTPAGYSLIAWEKLQPDPRKPAEIIPDAAYDLEPSDKNRDLRVYISGYIYPGRRMINIKEFILVPTVSHCNFCQTSLKSTEMILVKFTGDYSIDYSQNEIKLGGKFKIDPEQAANPFGGLPYQIEADYLQE
jgi:hypothetical protein